MPQQPPVSPRTTEGPLHAVPCPHCGKANDFRQLDETISSLLEGGTWVSCDHCGGQLTVVKVVPIKVVQVRQRGPAPQRQMVPNRNVPRRR